MSASAPVASSAPALTSSLSSAVPLHSFWDWAFANPVVVAAMIAGCVAFTVGLFTFTGVVMSLRHSRKESRRDREHSAGEAHMERLTTMRREVYLDAVGELVKVQSHVGTLAKQDITKTNIFAGLLGFQIAASKVAVVAEQATALKVRDLCSRYTLIMVNAMKILVPMTQARLAAEQFQRQYEEARDAYTSVLKEMDQVNKSGDPDPDKFERLSQSFRLLVQVAAEHDSNRANAVKTMNGFELDYTASIRSDIKSILLILDDLACAIRDELGVETDREAFRKQTDELFAAMEPAVNGLMNIAKGLNGENQP